MKKLLSYFLLVAIVFTFLSTYKVNIANAEVDKIYEGYSVPVKEGVKNHYIKDKPKDKIVYCFDPYSYDPEELNSGIKLPKYNKLNYFEASDSIRMSNGKIKELDYSKDKIAGVLYAGYPNDALGFKKKYNLTDEEARELTKYAIWYFRMEKDWFKGKVEDYTSELLNYAMKNKYSETLTFDGDFRLKQKGDVWTSDIISSEGPNNSIITFENLPEGMKIINADTNKEVNNDLKVGDKFFISYSKDKVYKSTFKVKYKYKSMDVDFYELIEDKAQKSYQNLIGSSSKDMSGEIDILVEAPPEPKITTTSASVKKVWEDNKYVDLRPEEVKVQLYRNNKAYGQVVKLNKENNWSHKWDKLDDSYKWTIDEINVPKGYIKSIKGNNNDFIITNKIITGKIEITKVDEADKRVLADAEFKIYDANKNLVTEGKTNEKGIATFELGYGKYYYQEVKAPEGYVLDNKLYPFEVKANGEVIKVEMKNKKITGKIEITKVDEADKKVLPKSGFKIYDDKKNVVTEGHTNEKGIASFELGYGKYYYQEIKAPEGYVLDEKLYPFDIKTNGQVIKVEMKNKKITGKIEITKVDEADKKVLPNAQFKIYDEQKNFVSEGKTNEKGIASFELGYGKYYYQEVKAPEGYVLDEKLYPFDIKTNGEIIKAKVENKKISGKLEITKTDISDGKLLPNAGFKIYDDKKNLVTEGKTNEEGIATFELGYGKYYYQEVKAPEGYVLDEKLYPFEVKVNGEVIKVEMKNKKITGKIEITKVDEADKKVLPNAEFKIYDANKNLVTEGKTNEKGIATFELGYGKYYYQEVKAPEGYVLDEKLYPFEIKSNGEVLKVKMNNAKEDKSESSEPKQPDESSNVSEPSEPEQPDESSNVSEPSEPEESDDLSNVSEPSEPEQPNEPINPSEPSEPEQPNEPINPSEPSEPEQPNEPISPNKPSEPEQPNEPINPSEPNEPEQPDEPINPNKPSEPEQPNEPINPSEPNEPEQPDEPINPSEPNEPEQPDEPINPSEPSRPEQPNEPINPSEPSRPEQPNEPINPSEPSRPEQPNEPISPSKPSEPKQPNDPTTNDSSTSITLPNTGGTSSKIYIMLSIGITFIGLSLLKKSK